MLARKRIQSTKQVTPSFSLALHILAPGRLDLIKQLCQKSYLIYIFPYCYFSNQGAGYEWYDLSSDDKFSNEIDSLLLLHFTLMMHKRAFCQCPSLVVSQSATLKFCGDVNAYISLIIVTICAGHTLRSLQPNLHNLYLRLRSSRDPRQNDTQNGAHTPRAIMTYQTSGIFV